jgi:hypothetical protein
LAETIYPDPLRAAITDRYKIIFNVKANLYELYDLSNDPWEKKNIWGKNDKAAEQKMKAVLEEWLERRYYSRDAATNQAQKVRAAALLKDPPKPQTAVDVVGGGAIRVVGWDAAKTQVKPGETLNLTVYFKCEEATDRMYKLEAEAILDQPAPATRAAVKQERVPVDGTFPTSRWRPGEYVKETFALKIPPAWTGSKVTIGFRFLDEKRAPAALEGPNAGDGKQAILGAVELLPPVGPAQPVPPQPGAPQPGPTPTAPLQR